MPTENQRANEFRKNWKLCYNSAHVQNLHDAPRGHFKPYDGFVVQDGMFIGIEFKKTTGQSINAKDMRNNQVCGLLDSQREGYCGLVIYFLEHKNYQNKILFCCPIKKFLKIFKGVHEGAGVYSWGPSMKIEKLIEQHNHLFVEKIKTPIGVTDGKIDSKLMWDFGKILIIPEL